MARVGLENAVLWCRCAGGNRPPVVGGMAKRGGSPVLHPMHPQDRAARCSAPALQTPFATNPHCAGGAGKMHREPRWRQLWAGRKILSLNQRGHLFSATSSGDSAGKKGALWNPFRPQIPIWYGAFDTTEAGGGGSPNSRGCAGR